MGLFTSNHGKNNDFAGVVANALKGKPDYPEVDPHTDDTLSLSYEEALKKHTRRPLAEEMSRIGQLAAAELETRRAAYVPVEAVVAAPLANTKAASITLRMSNDESKILRKRAVAAGISVSAYIRSCIFEAEELRAQVKNALAEIRLSRAAHHG
jgi:predicted DNA binding CopG/RHH family protein